MSRVDAPPPPLLPPPPLRSHPPVSRVTHTRCLPFSTPGRFGRRHLVTFWHMEPVLRRAGSIIRRRWNRFLSAINLINCPPRTVQSKPPDSGNFVIDCRRTGGRALAFVCTRHLLYLETARPIVDLYDKIDRVRTVRPPRGENFAYDSLHSSILIQRMPIASSDLSIMDGSAKTFGESSRGLHSLYVLCLSGKHDRKRLCHNSLMLNLRSFFFCSLILK